MKIAIVDDDAAMTGQIEEYLERFMRENKVPVLDRVFLEPKKFLAEFDGSYDLILLDVEMPEMNGIEVAREIREKDNGVMIMFITNMAQYAIHGYEVEAVDYVLKPLAYPDFAMKMQKVLRYFRRDRQHQLMLETSQGKVPMKVSDIFYIEVIRHYLNFHTACGVYQVRGVMKELEQELRTWNFVRCSQSYLVNLAYVRSLGAGVVLVGEDELPVSRNRKNEFVEAFTRYVGGMGQI